MEMEEMPATVTELFKPEILKSGFVLPYARYPA